MQSSSKTKVVPAKMLKYSANFNDNNLQLIEVDEAFIDEIFSKDNPSSTSTSNIGGHIKMSAAYSDGSKRQACLSTGQSTYKLKNSETSNLLMALQMPQQTEDSAEIVYCTNNFIEVTQTQRRDHQVVTMLRENHSVFGANSDRTAPATLQQVIDTCQISESELRDLLAQKALDYQILVKEANECAYIETASLMDLVDSILVMVCADEGMYLTFSPESILAQQQGEIKAIYHRPHYIDFALQYVATKNEDGSYSLCPEKVRKFAGLSLLAAKGDFQLLEFKAAHKNYLERVLTQSQLSQLENTPRTTDELFEGFGSEFAELKGHCILVPAAQNQTNINRTDDIIKYLHPLLSAEFADCITFESKLASAFSIKQKWTVGELEVLLKNTLEPEQVLSTMLQRNARTLKEPNPFDRSKTSVFYTKKF